MRTSKWQLLFLCFLGCTGVTRGAGGGAAGGASSGGGTAAGGGSAVGGGASTGGGLAAGGGAAMGGGSATGGGDAGTGLPNFSDRCVPVQPPAPPAPLRTLYIDGANGDDSRTGLSAAEAWKTLAKANGAVQAGDLVYVTGTFDGGYLRPAASGTAAHPIVFQANAATIMNAQYNIGLWVAGLSYVEFDGFELTGDEAPTDFLNCDHVVVRNSYLHDATGYVRFIDSSDNRFENNRWLDCPSYCFFMSGGANRNVVAHNQLGGASNVMLYLAGSAADPSADNVITFNELGPTRDGQLLLTGAITGTVLSCNRIHGAGTPDAGAGPSIILTASNNVVRENLIYDNRGEPIRLQAFSGNDSTGNLISHNDVWGNDGPDLRFLLSEPAAVLEDNEVVDNIFWGNNLTFDSHWVSNGVGYRVVFDTYHQQLDGYPDGGLGNNRIHHNLVGSSAADFDGGWLYFIGYTTNRTYNLAEAQARWPAELHDDFEADPLFARPDAGQFMLLPGSPAIDRAVDDGGFVFTGAAPDLGRYEWVP